MLKQLKTALASLAILIPAGFMSIAQASIVNPSFEDGLDGWTVEGTATTDNEIFVSTWGFFTNSFDGQMAVISSGSLGELSRISQVIVVPNNKRLGVNAGIFTNNATLSADTFGRITIDGVEIFRLTAEDMSGGTLGVEFDVPTGIPILLAFESVGPDSNFLADNLLFIEASPVPVPGTLSFLVCGSVILARFRKKAIPL